MHKTASWLVVVMKHLPYITRSITKLTNIKNVRIHL